MKYAFWIHYRYSVLSLLGFILSLMMMTGCSNDKNKSLITTSDSLNRNLSDNTDPFGTGNSEPQSVASPLPPLSFNPGTSSTTQPIQPTQITQPTNCVTDNPSTSGCLRNSVTPEQVQNLIAQTAQSVSSLRDCYFWALDLPRARPDLAANPTELYRQAQTGLSSCVRQIEYLMGQQVAFSNTNQQAISNDDAYWAEVIRQLTGALNNR